MNITMWKKQWLYAVLFFAVIVALFLGDGPEHVIDVLFIPIIGIVLYLIYKQRRDPIKLPVFPAVCWVGAIFYVVVQIFVSESPGLTISGLVRLIEGFLVYYIVYAVLSPKMYGVIQKAILAYIGVAIIAFVVLLLLGTYVPKLPSMNLLTYSYGHNHIVDLLLITLPLVGAGSVLGKKLRQVLLLSILIGIVVSFSRGAWLLSALYFLFIFPKQHNKIVPSRVIIASLFLILLFISTVISLNPERIAGRFSYLSQYLHKPVAVSDSRVNYWKYGWEILQSHPVFGSGFGTYYIQSKKLQAQPNTISWFAHNYVLQILSELGITGFIFFGGVIFYHIWIAFCLYIGQQKSQKEKDLNISSVGAALLLVFAYSLYEFNINFLIVWLLFWILAAMVARYRSDTLTKRSKQVSLSAWVACCCLVLGLYYVSVVSSEVVLVMKKDSRLAYWLSPFRVSAALIFVSSFNGSGEKIDQRSERLIMAFHKNDTEVLFELAKQNIKRGMIIRARELFKRSIALDPQDYQKKLLAIRYLVQNNDMIGAGGLIRSISSNQLGRSHQSALAKIDFDSTDYQAAYGEAFNRTIFNQDKTEELAKLYYLMGLRVYKKKPQTTRMLWTLARDISPGWGYYHAELASLEQYVFRDVETAQKVLRYCEIFSSAKKQCGELLEAGVFPVGFFERNINAIPIVLTSEN